MFISFLGGPLDVLATVRRVCCDKTIGLKQVKKHTQNCNNGNKE